MKKRILKHKIFEVALKKLGNKWELTHQFEEAYHFETLKEAWKVADELEKEECGKFYPYLVEKKND